MLLAAIVVAGPPVPQPSLVLPGCLISAIDQVEAPAMQAGVLTEVAVRRGQEVQEQQVIGQIDDRDARQKLATAKLEHESAQRKAENQLRVKAAELSAAVATKEHERMVATNRSQAGAVPEAELQRLKLAEEHAVLQIELARRELHLATLDQGKWKSQMSIAQNDVDDRRMLAPRGGVVAEVLKRKGEWVQQAEPVFRIVRMDRLRVEGFVNLGNFNPEELKGARVEVSVELARGQTAAYSNNLGETRQAKLLQVDFVSHEVEANGSYRISAEVDNRRTARGDLWVLQPGMNAKLSIWVNPAE